MISNAPFSEVISHILHPIWPLVEWKLLIDTKVLLLRSEIHFTYHNEDQVNSQISISIQTYNWSQTSQRLHHLKVSFWQFLNFAGLFGVWSSLWLYHTQSQKLMFFYTRYSSENHIHRYPSIYLFLKIEGLLLQMKYAEYCRNPQNLYLLRVTPVCLNLMMSFAVWLVYFAVYVNCGSQVTLCRSVLCRESVRSSGHFTGCRQKKKINR